jgi:hypothetical protein
VMELDSDEDLPNTPPEVKEAANLVTLELYPLQLDSDEKISRFFDGCRKKYYVILIFLFFVVLALFGASV